INNKDVLFRVGCQAGTYIRKLIHDFGLKLGTGAHMKQLVRTKVSVFTDQNWHSLQDLKDAYEFYKEGSDQELRKIILPFEHAVSHLPKVWVFDSAVSNLAHGSDLYTTGISKLNSFNENEQVAVFTIKNELICLGQSILNSEAILKQEKKVAINTKKVFIPRDLYHKEKGL
ncbi:RNA-guided pseudouridylation complex pseudouridine synthase subunit Cbf5, partial [Candidatus Woesearchaeota archaeon]|nr:RNA-guided pseudouridylation complex pseudouridine synthase subunit Cbf5 [Candidatus Woesearchaeota archaeon]